MKNYTINDLHLLMLHAGYAVHNGDWNWQNVKSPFARIYYVSEGTAQIIMPDGIHQLTPNHLYLIPPNTLHTDICTGHFVHYYVHIYEDPSYDTNVFDEADFPFELDALPEDERLMQRLIDLNPQMRLPQSNPRSYDNQPSIFSNIQVNLSRSFPDRLESRGITYTFEARFIREARPKEHATDDRIRKTLKYIRHHIGEPIDVGTLSSMVYLTKDHYIRLFRKQTGFTPNVYITNKKMERAELLLLSTDIPIKQIARDLGYEDLSYFIRLFRKYANTTPQHYRSMTN